MSDDFNAYHKWLGIAPSEQPPNHYRLLGVNVLESDADVIASAADRQMSHLRSFQNGPRAKDCQQLLNEVANARLILLDPKKKASYDQALQTAVVSIAPAQGAPNVPLAPSEFMPPEPEQTAPTLGGAIPGTPAPAACPIVVSKPTKRRRRQSVGVVPMVIGGVVGFVVILASFFGIRWVNQSAPGPGFAKANSVTEATARPDIEVIESEIEPVESPSTAPVPPDTTVPSEHTSEATPLTNFLIDAQEVYSCTLRSQPRVKVDDAFDSTKSWRLSMQVEAAPHRPGTILCWGDSRPGMDTVCIKAGPDYVYGWVMDNTKSEVATNFPKVHVDWSHVETIELIHDSVSQLAQLRVDQCRYNIALPEPPRADRPMPVHLGGVGAGALHAFPCTIRDLRLEQLPDPVELPPPTVPTTSDEQQITSTSEAPKMPSDTKPNAGSLGDLVNHPVNKLSPPTGTDLQRAREQVQTLFSTDLNNKRTPQESAALADKLIGEAKQPGTAPAIQFALLETAIDVATNAGAVQNAAIAITALDTAFDIDVVQRRTDAALAIAKVAQEAWEHKAVVELLEVVIDQCLADDRYDLGMSLVESAQVAARKTKDSATTGRVADRLKEVRSLKVKYEPILEQLRLLSREPNQPDANHQVGTHLCLVKGKWQDGLPHLVKGPASDLRAVAAKDIRKPTNAATQAAIGHEWQAVAINLDRTLQLRALERAEHWLRLAAEQESGLKRVPLDSKIEEIGKQIGKMANLPQGAVLVMTFEPSTLKKRGYVMDVSQHGHVGVVSGAVLTEGIAGNALGFDGKDDFVEIAPTRWLAAPPAFTLSAWVNIVSWKNPRDARDYVLSNETRGTLGYVLRFRDAGTADLTLGARDWFPTLSTKKASLKQWHHIAASFDEATSRVYLDGELEAEKSTPFSLTPSTQPFRIGQGALRKDRGLFGRIDEVAMFNRVLSPEEVRTVFRIGQAGRRLMD